MADSISMINNSSLISSFWSEGLPILLDKIAPLFGVLKAIGIAVIVYIVFLIVKSILAMRDHRRLKRVEEKLDLLLDKLHIKGKETTKLVKEEKKILKKEKKKKV
jgi:uncharacterized membrane protein